MTRRWIVQLVLRLSRQLQRWLKKEQCGVSTGKVWSRYTRDNVRYMWGVLVQVQVPLLRKSSGTAEIATQAETDAGADDGRMITSAEA